MDKVTIVGQKDEDATLMVRTLEILWHCNQRSNEAELMGLQNCAAEGVTSIDWNAEGNRLLTTGGDKCLRIWDVDRSALSRWMEDGTKDMTACVRHVSCMFSSWMPMTARWSPRGKLVASSHCDGKICLWWQERSAETGTPTREENGDEVWKDFRHLSGHVNDVYDISFSPDSRYLISAGGDGCVLIHDLKGSTMPVVQLSECHTKFCRGVAWDPWNRFLVTFGGGPSLQVFSHVPERVSDNIVRRLSVAGQRRSQGDYIGDTCGIFFRRVSWSPDGLLLAVPFGKAGHISHAKKKPETVAEASEKSEENCAESDMVHCVNIYARNTLEKVAARIVTRGYSEVRGVCWAPCFLDSLSIKKKLPAHPFFHPPNGKLESQRNIHVDVQPCDERDMGAWGPKAYRMALAAWTPDAVIVYTTDSGIRHSDFTDLHMRSITDVAWAPDARYLLTGALDGYVSVIAFRGTLSKTHRLPLFAQSSPAVKSMCHIFEELKNSGTEIENSYSYAAPQAAPTTVAAVVKKKKRVEQSATAINPDELLDLMKQH